LASIDDAEQTAFSLSTGLAMISNDATSQMHNMFAKAFETHLARVEAFYGQVAETEQKALEQSKTAFEESARLSRESLAYSSTLAAEWRKASLEATRNAIKMMSTPMFPFAG
jgi:hypothetical protein